MFMNQISVFENDEVTAYGFYKINLSVVISVSLCLTQNYIDIYNNVHYLDV